MFYEKFLKLCAEANKTPSSVAGEIGLSRSAVSNWKARGSCPTAVTAQKLADYFGVPVDYLLSDETDEKTKKAAPADGDGFDIDNFVDGIMDRDVLLDLIQKALEKLREVDSTTE